MFYEIPATLDGEIDELDFYVQRFLNGDVDAASLKLRRVPFGCYEQREDGKYMLRLRCPGGAVTPRQLGAIAGLSKQYGSDFIHITTRQGFQIHDLRLQDIVPVMRKLLDAGLATRGGGGNTVRNILVSPDAGVAPDEVFDPEPYAFALTTRLIAEPDSWLLPRKFKIAFSNSAQDSANAQFNCLGFIAALKDGEKGFRVSVAGGLGAKPEAGHLLHDFLPAEDVYFVAKALKRVFDLHGNRKDRHAARLRFLWNQLGEERFRELYEAELQRSRRNDPPLVIATNQRPVASPAVASVIDESLEFLTWKRRYVAAQRQPALHSILVPVFLGNLRNEAAIALADFLKSFGEDVLRATMQQNLLLRNIPEEYLGNVYAVVKGISELASTPVLLANSVSCTGADTCRLGICLPKGALRAIAEKLTASELDLDQIADFRLHLSGCPNTCGQHMVADLGFYGKVGRRGGRMCAAYGVVAGATTHTGEARLGRNLGQVSADVLPDFVHDVFETWIREKPGFRSFAAWVDGEGKNRIGAFCEHYRATSDAINEKDFFDWGASEPFSLAGRSSGECSAGPFDLIEIDRRRIQEARRHLSGAQGDTLNECLYNIVLTSARMLLITRGVDARSDAAAFAAFSTGFIASGLVAASFQPVIEAAQERDYGALREASSQVETLADAVEGLYAKLDRSLRFQNEEGSPIGQQEISHA